MIRMAGANVAGSLVALALPGGVQGVAGQTREGHVL